jgi:hypothetical protein
MGGRSGLSTIARMRPDRIAHSRCLEPLASAFEKPVRGPCTSRDHWGTRTAGGSAHGVQKLVRISCCPAGSWQTTMASPAIAMAMAMAIPRIPKSRGAHLKSQQGACREEGHMLSYSERVEATSPLCHTNSRAVAGGENYTVQSIRTTGWIVLFISRRGKKKVATQRVQNGRNYTLERRAPKYFCLGQAPISGPSPGLATYPEGRAGPSPPRL